MSQEPSQEPQEREYPPFDPDTDYTEWQCKKCGCDLFRVYVQHAIAYIACHVCGEIQQ